MERGFQGVHFRTLTYNRTINISRSVLHSGMTTMIRYLYTNGITYDHAMYFIMEKVVPVRRTQNEHRRATTTYHTQNTTT